MLQDGMSEEDVVKELAKLKQPISPDKISWKVKTTYPANYRNLDTKNGAAKLRILVMPYFDARNMMDILDDVVGPHRWMASYRELSDGKLVCTISIKIKGEWVAKEDGTGSSGDDAADDGQTQARRDTGKGDFTIAFKRTAQGPWGIGRYLYQISAIWVEGTWNGKKLDFSIPALPSEFVPEGSSEKKPPAKSTQRSKPPAKPDTEKPAKPPKREANDNQDGLTKAMLDVVIPDGTGAPVKDTTFADLVNKWKLEEGDEGYEEKDKEFVEIVIGYLAGIKKSPNGKEFHPTDDQTDLRIAAKYVWEQVLGYKIE